MKKNFWSRWDPSNPTRGPKMEKIKMFIDTSFKAHIFFNMIITKL